MNQITERTKQPPIERALDELNCQLDELEKTISRTLEKTETIRNHSPVDTTSDDVPRPNGSLVTVRIDNSTRRLRELRAMLEQCVSEIEL